MRRLFGSQPTFLPILKQANACINSGDYLAAASAYEQLLEQSGPQPGPQFAFVCLQAGSARLHAGQTAKAMNHFRRGLDILTNHNRYAQMFHSGQRIKAELEKRGLMRETQAFMAQIQSCIPAAAEIPTQHINQQLPTLPPICPTCGGFIRVFELHWLNAHTAECLFCASPLEIA